MNDPTIGLCWQRNRIAIWRNFGALNTSCCKGADPRVAIRINKQRDLSPADDGCGIRGIFIERTEAGKALIDGRLAELRVAHLMDLTIHMH